MFKVSLAKWKGAAKTAGGVVVSAVAALEGVTVIANTIEKFAELSDTLGLVDNPLSPQFLLAPRPVLAHCDAYVKGNDLVADDAVRDIYRARGALYNRAAAEVWVLRRRLGWGGYFDAEVDLLEGVSRVPFGQNQERWNEWRDTVDAKFSKEGRLFSAASRVVLSGRAPHALWMYLGHKFKVASCVSEVKVVHKPLKGDNSVFKVVPPPPPSKSDVSFFSSAKDEPSCSILSCSHKVAAELLYVTTNPRNTLSRSDVDRLRAGAQITTMVAKNKDGEAAHVNQDNAGLACAEIANYFGTRNNDVPLLMLTSTLTPLAFILGHSINTNKMRGPIVLLDRTRGEPIKEVYTLK
eukprot:TRINITY_DN15148_c0_g1_i1.p1 TRINITY_DN15148_c0_g1~~TRINITY_DN15148_c0_g1_i1.p1  ORF type:complete len:372 (-),score=100.95 TRINITY_DN15148_c0_g1_i1:9-1061(-)